ncbi:MAG: DUF2306 domain-containing protein [Micropepsaceae bacterium]
MPETIANAARPRVGIAAAALKVSAQFWYAVAAIGQLAFVYFIAVFYIPPTLQGQLEAWNRKPLITGYVAGDDAGNLNFAVHVVLAALITASGLLQLLPVIRRRAPGFHRWNGRLFLALAVVMSLGGLWLVWVRGTYLTMAGAVSISLLGVLILLSAFMTVRHAMARRIALHERWALRLFLLSSGVWFQRVGYMAWIILNDGPAGIGPQMDGPFDIVWGFGQFMLPLAVLELYFLARRSRSTPVKLAVAGLLTALTLVMAVGIFGTVAIMWWRFL